MTRASRLQRSRPRGSLERLATLAAVSVALACQGILGIERLDPGQRPLAGGSGGSGGAAGDSAQPAPAGGTAGTRSGPASGLAPDMPAAAGGSASLTPPEALPDAGSRDGGAAAGILVSGRVIDFSRRPVPDTPVTIGGVTVTTSAQGEFAIDGVEPPYTATLVIHMVRGGGQARYGYAYEGLTRRDPTLQVYAALVEREARSLSVSFENVSFADGAFAMLAFGSPNGRFVDADVTGNTEFLGSPSWTGPQSLDGNIHALLAVADAASDAPATYVSHQSLPLSVTDGLPASVAFDLGTPNVETGSLSGTASGGVTIYPSHYVAARFADGAAMPIIEENNPLESFSYALPSLPDATFVFGAADGISSSPPYAVIHRENIPLGASDLAFAIPRSVILSSPQSGAAVDASTPYAWSPAAQSAQTFLWHLEFDATYEGMFVLTGRTQIELPEFADGFTVPAGVDVTWSVETHGDAPDVDALTGPDGYLDAFSLGTAFPAGPNRSDGYYTESERRSFTMGP